MSRPRKTPVTATPVPIEQLIAIWAPLLRRMAWEMQLDLAEVEQIAWQLGLELQLRPPRSRKATWTTCWMRHVRWACRRQRPQAMSFGDGEEGGGDDDGRPDPFGSPEQQLSAAQAIDARFGGVPVDQLIATPTTAREIAELLGVTVRHARRILAEMRALGAVQGDFWGVTV